VITGHSRQNALASAKPPRFGDERSAGSVVRSGRRSDSRPCRQVPSSRSRRAAAALLADLDRLLTRDLPRGRAGRLQPHRNCGGGGNRTRVRSVGAHITTTMPTLYACGPAAARRRSPVCPGCLRSFPVVLRSFPASSVCPDRHRLWITRLTVAPPRHSKSAVPHCLTRTRSGGEGEFGVVAPTSARGAAASAAAAEPATGSALGTLVAPLLHLRQVVVGAVLGIAVAAHHLSGPLARMDPGPAVDARHG
jgi:hypothetical protein